MIYKLPTSCCISSDERNHCNASYRPTEFSIVSVSHMDYIALFWASFRAYRNIQTPSVINNMTATEILCLRERQGY